MRRVRWTWPIFTEGQVFQLDLPGRASARWLDASKHTVREYVAHKRCAPLPAGYDYWDFVCRFGNTEQESAEVHFVTLIPCMDASMGRGDSSFFVSIRRQAAVPGQGGNHSTSPGFSEAALQA